MSEELEQSPDSDATLPAQEHKLPMRTRADSFPQPEELAELLPADAYRVDCFLGQGGMGTVYKGLQVRLKRAVAIKVMRRDQGKDHNFEQRFHREALAMAELNHPNIVTVIDYGEAGTDYLYIVMEFVDGADLMDVIRSGRMTQEMALILLPQICDALQFAHDHGIVHRDIKPSNIMLSRDGRIKVADFGLAKRPDVENTFVTRTGLGMGTPDYAAPEQFDSQMLIDHRADIYALGVMIYQMLTGHLPRGVWRAPSQRAKVSPQWDDIVSQAIQADPKDRYQSASEIKTDLRIIPPDEKSAHLATKNISPIRKSRVPFLATAVGMVVLLSFSTFLIWRKSGTSPTAQQPVTAAFSPSPHSGYNVIKIGSKPEDLIKTNDSQMVYDVVWENGTLVMGKNQGKGQIFDYRAYARDSILRADVRFDPNTSSPQLCLRNQAGEKQGTFYRLWADLEDKTWKLAFINDWRGYTLIQKWKLQRPLKDTDWVSLEIRAIGNQITAVIDSQVLGTFTHDGIPNAGGYQLFTNGRSDFRNVEFIILDPPATPSNATRDAPFVNSLGMKFVPVPITGGPTHGQRKLFSMWETRESDYDVFAKATRRIWSKDPYLDHGPEYPATNLCWDDAVAFCSWLTERERGMSKLNANQYYRLPSDHEWSCAVGIGDKEDGNAKPFEKRNKIRNIYPWGATWPPPANSGNFWSEELRPVLASGRFSWIHSELTGYQDGFATLAPVGTYKANYLGLYDLGGNAAELCMDWYDDKQTQRVARGSDWSFIGSTDKNNGTLLSSYRFGLPPDARQNASGVRIVLIDSGH